MVCSRRRCAVCGYGKVCLSLTELRAALWFPNFNASRCFVRCIFQRSHFLHKVSPLTPLRMTYLTGVGLTSLLSEVRKDATRCVGEQLCVRCCRCVRVPSSVCYAGSHLVSFLCRKEALCRASRLVLRSVSKCAGDARISRQCEINWSNGIRT